MNKVIKNSVNNIGFVNEQNIKKSIMEYGLFNFIESLIGQLERYYLLLANGKIERSRRHGFVNNMDCSEVMSCRLINESYCFKVVSFRKLNNNLSLPSVISNTILCDDETGLITANIGSSFLTYIRTGAATALATKYIYRDKIKSTGFIGAGCVSQLTAIALAGTNKELEKIYVWDCDLQTARIFKDRIERLTGIEVIIEEPSFFMSKINVVNTATYGNEIILKKEWLSGRSLHINAMGADTSGKQEIDSDILLDTLIATDYKEQAIGEGELNVPIADGIFNSDNIYCELVDLINNSKTIPANKKMTLYDSTGDALQDLAVTNLLLKINIEQSKTNKNINLDSNYKDPLEQFLTDE